MIDYLLLFFISFIVTYLLISLNIKFSRKFGIVDIPGNRSMHNDAIPSAGGLSIAIPVLMFQLILYTFTRNTIYLKFGLGSFLFLLLGYFDDKKKFTANHKFFFQLIITVILCLLKLKITIITNPFGSDIELGILSYPVTIIWFLLVINAFNLIDGIDGLASGIAIIVSSVLLVVSLTFSNYIVVYSSIVLIGSNLAFLKYNFFPARIFMGDSGSLLVGFNIAAISVAGSIQFKGITTMTLVIPIIALGIPFIDTILAIFRRLKNRRNIFEADKEHLHHILFASGFSQKSISIIGYVLTFLLGLIAIGFSLATQEILLIILFVHIIVLMMLFYYIFFIKLKQENNKEK